MRIHWLSLFIIVCDFLRLVEAVNSYSHVFERIWLWEMYDLFCNIEGGAHNQNMIMEQDPRHKWTLEKNIGSGPNGKLTFAEFQLRLEGKSPTLIDMTPPAADYHRAAKQILDLGWAKQLNPHKIITGLDRWPVDLDIDPSGDSYTTMVEVIEKQYTHYHYNVDGFEVTYKDRMTRIQALSDMIAALRFEDSSVYFSNKWRRPKEYKGFGLNIEVDKHYVKTDSTYKGSNAHRWKKIDVARVWEDNAILGVLQDAGYKTREDLFNLARRKTSTKPLNAN